MSKRQPSRRVIQLAASAAKAVGTDDEQQAAAELCGFDTERLLSLGTFLAKAADSKERILGARLLSRGIGLHAGNDHARIAILGDLAGKDCVGQVRCRAIRFLGDIGSISAARVIVRHVKDPSSEIRLAVVQALACVPKLRPMSAIVQLATDTDPRVREWAAFTLGMCPRNPQMLKVLSTLTRDKRRDVRLEAIRSLVKLGDFSVLMQAVMELKLDGVSETRFTQLFLRVCRYLHRHHTHPTLVGVIEEFYMGIRDHVWNELVRANQSTRGATK